MLTENEVFCDMEKRTGGECYIGVVGPVRSGKSTFIKNFMETLVLPDLIGEEKMRLIDALPQSAEGKTVMTTEPKFVPEKAACITVGTTNTKVNVRLIDCVGYPIEGAFGFTEEGAPRLINTPWSDRAMPFEQAAQLGTEKVIKEHSTIGILVTSDGSFTDLPRESYVSAEERTVRELKALGKPFVILLNCKEPSSSSAQALIEELREKYGVTALAVNCLTIGKEDFMRILSEVLFEFPVKRIDFAFPDWMQVLPADGAIVSSVLSTLKRTAGEVRKMRDCFRFENVFADSEYLKGEISCQIDMGEGSAVITLSEREGVFYTVLGRECGEDLSSDKKLMRYVRALSESKREYDKIRSAFAEAKANGYGVAAPDLDAIALERPSVLKEGGGYGVRFRAAAPSYHIVRVDVNGEVSPMAGNKEQSEEFISGLIADFDESPEKLWEKEFFGKSLKEILGENLSSKISSMPPLAQKKIMRSLTRMVNDGKSNLLCFVF